MCTSLILISNPIQLESGSQNKSQNCHLPEVEDEVGDSRGALAAATAEAMVGRSLYSKVDLRADAAAAAADLGTGGSAHSITVNGSANDLNCKNQ
jgi:hypothetical protein